MPEQEKDLLTHLFISFDSMRIGSEDSPSQSNQLAGEAYMATSHNAAGFRGCKFGQGADSYGLTMELFR